MRTRKTGVSEKEGGTAVVGGSSEGEAPRRSGRGRVVGLVLLVACAVLYAVSAAVFAFAPLAPEWRLGAAAALAVAAEGAFWLAAILLGREVVRRYRRALNPLNWFGGRLRKQAGRLEEGSSEGGNDPGVEGGER